MPETRPPLRLCAIAGDGIGREVIPAAVDVLQAVLPDLQVTWARAGWDVFRETGNALPNETVAAARAARAVLFGATSSPSHRVPGYQSPIVSLRRLLDTFANLRPARRRLPPDNGLNLLVVRENTEGAYSRRERLEGDTAIAERIITRRGSQRVARVAFELAAASGRRLTIVHKANVRPVSDGLWRETCLAVAAQWPRVVVDEVLVDAAAYHLTRDPRRFQLLLAPNLYGDILSDLASALADGLGMAPSLSLGTDYGLAEPVHGSAPDIAGQGIANPIAAVLSAAMLARHWWQRPDAAQRIENTVAQVLADGLRTPDIAKPNTPTVGTAQITHALLERL